MAVVGEAHIVVRAITTSVKDDIRRGFDGAEDTIKKTGQTIARTFQSDFAREADAARERWAALTKTSFKLQTAVGTLAAGVADLAGGLGAIVGAAAGAAASITALGSAMITLKVGFSIAKFAFGGIAQAVQAATKANGGYGKSLKQIAFDAEEAALTVDRASLNLEKAREALLRTQDLPGNSVARKEAQLAYNEAELALRKAKAAKDAAKDGATGGGGGADPYAGLTPSQKKFAQYLATLKPLLDDLKEAAAKGFLPILQSQLERIVASPLPKILETAFFRIGQAMGLAAANFTDRLLSPRNIANLQDVLSNMSRLIPSFGNIAGDVYSSLLTILKAADPLTRKFVGFLEKKSAAFTKFLDTKAASGELEAFFNRSGQLAADFGKVFGNTFNFLGDVVKANFGTVGGGQYMLNWLKGATKKWADLSENMGKANLQGYFIGASKNSKAVLQSVGSLVKEIGKLGDMPEIKKTFDTLALGAPYLGTIFREGAKAGPILADLIVQITKIASIFADSGQINVYFGTLRNVAKVVADLFSNEIFQSLVNIVTQIGGVVLAVGTLSKTFGFVFKVISGVILGPINMIKGMPLAFTTATTAAGKFGVALRGAFGVAGIIAAVVAGVMALSDQLDQVKKDSMLSGEGIRNSFLSGKSALDVMKEALEGTEGKLTFLVDKTADFQLFGEYDVKTTGMVVSNMDDLATNGEKFRMVLAGLSKEATGFGKSTQGTSDWFDTESDWTKIETAINNTGSALAQIAGSSIPDASAKFLELTKAYQMSDADARRFLEAMPDLKTQLAETAKNAGMATDDTTLLNIAMQRGGDYSNIMASGLGGVDTAADNAAKKVQWLSDKILGFGKTNLDTRESVRRFEAAVDSVTESVKTNGSTLDITTAAGRSNQSALDDLAKAAVNQATAVYKATGNTDELTKSMAKGRESLIDAAKEMGLTKDEAAKLADTLLGTPKEIKIAVDANTGKAVEELESLKKNYGQGSGFWDNVFGWMTGTSKKKDGGVVGGYSNGGYVRRLAPGGYVSGTGTARSDSIPAMLSNGEYVINARATSENRALLDRINNNQSISMAPSISVTVNPSAGMDERALAELVSRRIAFEIRKGTI